jgi:hypothetical protein
VLAVRRCKDDGIDRRVGEERIKIVRQSNAVLSAKALGGGARAGITGSETDCGALALHGIDQHPSPPPDADDRGTDHFDFLLEKNRAVASGSGTAQVDVIASIIAHR